MGKPVHRISFCFTSCELSVQKIIYCFAPSKTGVYPVQTHIPPAFESTIHKTRYCKGFQLTM
jgi:hypothetical protein